MSSARPSLRHARRSRRTLSAVSAVALTVVAVFAATGGLDLGRARAPQVPAGPTPWDFTTTMWDQSLGGDQALTDARYATLQAWADPALGDQVEAVRTLATQVVDADLTGAGQDSVRSLAPAGVAPYWPAGTPAAAQCQSVHLTAVSPAALPVHGPATATLGQVSAFAKTLVTFTGTCAGTTYTTTSPGVRYVYAGKTSTGWIPLRYWQVPVPGQADQVTGAPAPYDWELEQLTGPCAPAVVVRDRIAVVDAFEQMCTAAANAGVHLSVTAGYRTRTEQAAVFQAAVKAYGSVANARKQVAYADQSVCTSKHCSGLAFTVDATSSAVAWLSTTVGCATASGITVATSCPAGATPVTNPARWGFAQPLASSPGYLEFSLPLPAGASSSLGAPACTPTAVPVANQVAAIFRCRLAREGIVGAQAEQVVAEALTVSRCESGWNPAAAAYGGKFATAPDPVTGRTYTQRGVFMISAEVADAGWVSGGADSLGDPVENINGAASLWLATRSWVAFGCATGTKGGFEAGPVLPAYGGPALPAWSGLY